MKKFLVLYCAPAATIAKWMKMPPEAGAAEMEMWNKWAKANKKTIVDVGMPLGKTRRVSAKGVAPTKNGMTGYSVIQAASPEAAVKFIEKHPFLQSGKGVYIDVLDCIEM